MFLQTISLQHITFSWAKTMQKGRKPRQYGSGGGGVKILRTKS